MLGRIFLGILLAIVGFGIVKRPDILADIIGPVGFAERFMRGGTRSFFKIVGVIIILIGFLIMTNLESKFINFMLDFIY